MIVQKWVYIPGINFFGKTLWGFADRQHPLAEVLDAIRSRPFGLAATQYKRSPGSWLMVGRWFGFDKWSLFKRCFMFLSLCLCHDMCFCFGLVKFDDGLVLLLRIGRARGSVPASVREANPRIPLDTAVKRRKLESEAGWKLILVLCVQVPIPSFLWQTKK